MTALNKYKWEYWFFWAMCAIIVGLMIWIIF